MGKVITSPIKRWPGTVTLKDSLTFEELIRFVDARREAAQFTRVERDGQNGEQRVAVYVTDQARYYNAMLPGAMAAIEKWELTGKGAPVHGFFPATPIRSSLELARWLVDAVRDHVTDEEEEVPNG